MNWTWTGLVLLLMLVQVNSKALKKKSSPASPKRKARHHIHRHRDHKKSSVRSLGHPHSSDPILQELINDPQKLDTDEMQQVKMLDFYNSKFMNSELATESQMLINQGIDADSARRIATMDRLPGINSHRSNGFENGVSKDTFSSKLGMDIARWPEYHFKDSGGYHIATTTDNKPDPQYISTGITHENDNENDDDEGNHMGTPTADFSMGHDEESKDYMGNGMMEGEHAQTVVYGHPHASMFDTSKESHPSMDVYDKPVDHDAQMANMFGEDKVFDDAPVHGGNHHASMRLGTSQGHVRSKSHRYHGHPRYS